MINKSSRTPSANAVHALFHGAAKIGNLGIFTAKFDDCISVGYDFFHCLRAGNHFLDKGKVQTLREADTGRTGKHHRQQLFRYCRVRRFNHGL
jgi:hypothetical protein